MADDVVINAVSGTAGATIAADDINNVHYQRVKITYGVDGVATDVSSAAPMPVLVDSALNTDDLLGDILTELRTMNFHLGLMTGNAGFKIDG